MSNSYQTPLVHATTSIGKTKYWQGFAKEVNGQSTTWTEFWQDAGKHTISEPTITVGKQKRTDWEQAIFEINATLQTKLKKGYVSDEVKLTVDRPPIIPMLAHSFGDRGHNLLYPCFAQRKFNGIRALYDGKTFWTREGNKVIAECVQHLHFPVESGLMLDGELVLPEPYTFQDTIRAVKKYRGDEASKLEFHVYDAYDDSRADMPFAMRLRYVEGVRDLNKYVFAAKTTQINSADELNALHAQHVNFEWEGTIARNAKGVYKPGHRSADLLKVKDTNDGEYTITGYLDGTGKDAGAIIFTCETPEGLSFNVRTSGALGTLEKRREMYENGHDFIGRPLTVKYQTLTDDLVPLFPVGVAIRNYE